MLAVLVIIGVAVSAAKGSSSKSATTSAAAPSHSVPAVPGSAPATQVAPPAAAATSAPTAESSQSTQPTAPAASSTLLKTSGDGIKNTASFTTGDNWTIHYTYDCSAFGTQGNMQIYVDYPNGDIAANALGEKGADSTTETGAGTHTLKVNSECKWTVEVTSG
ncbi:hypothetical protein LN042_35895 [Kitasatospora sp. RB6PN24]|uniref:hypothetical protein n=1 Tax=Kitasatospora humi TaxID=2893891 RepID=UPI001E5123EC|nr:hypothetical protein [Kitasatospora humi]MCC9312378.1 hypothetical protein [Kitasatospora humi]